MTSTVHDGKVAVVTGAGRGIGRAVAERLSADGATIVVNYARSQGAAQALVDAIHHRGGRAAAIQADVGRVDQVRFLFTEVDRLFGRLDILVNNAAVTKGALLEEVGESLFDQMFAVNVKGALFAGQEAARRLGPGGRIVNISSSTTVFAMPGASLYAGGKAALRTFTEVWAKELGPRGITVNTVLPGPTSPGSFDDAPAQLRDQAAAASPFGRIGTAAEVAAVVAFLCSEDARWISGQHLLVNGAASL
jgi:3-oxoacyl-[acyl-carrier protein] reductase